MYYFIVGSDWMKKGELDNMDFFSMILSGSIHDFEHPGYNNMYLINTKHEFALRYNDISVLENHHVAASFKLINQKGFNILQPLSVED